MAYDRRPEMLLARSVDRHEVRDMLSTLTVRPIAGDAGEALRLARQLAALETSTSAIILTGNLKPSPLILDQAEKLGVPILLVETNTMETVEKIEQSMGKTRLGQTEKLETFQHLMEENIQLDSIYEVLEID
jgi:predicted transcriptional regulator